MSQCPNCGKTIPAAEMRFCVSCGKKIETSSKEGHNPIKVTSDSNILTKIVGNKTDKTKNNNSRLIFIISVATIFAVALIAYFFLNNSSENTPASVAKLFTQGMIKGDCDNVFDLLSNNQDIFEFTINDNKAPSSKSSISREDFIASCKKEFNGSTFGNKQITDFQFTNENISGNNATVKCSVGIESITYELLKENGEWKVSDIS